MNLLYNRLDSQTVVHVKFPLQPFSSAGNSIETVCCTSNDTFTASFIPWIDQGFLNTSRLKKSMNILVWHTNLSAAFNISKTSTEVYP